MASTKKTKRVKPFNLEYEVRGLGVMMENMGDQLQLIAEQHGDIKKTLDVHSKILETHTRMIADMTAETALIHRDIQILKLDVEFIKHGLKRKIDTEEFATLERRVMLLEKRR